MGSLNAHCRSRVYVLDPYHEDAIALLQTNPGIEVILPSDPKKQNWHSDAIAVLVRSETQITAADIDRSNSNLKCIVKQGVGIDNIDVDAAQKRGIEVCTTPALNSETVAELTITLALCIARRVCEVDRQIRTGDKVIRSKMLGKSLHRKTLGVVGMGNIGREVARKWIAAMEGDVIAYDPYAKEGCWEAEFHDKKFRRVDDLQDLLQTTDVVTLHVPLTASTRNLISTSEFKMMRDGTILLNCARGGIVNETAMFEALQSERLFGVGLDAMQYEPPTLSKYGETLLSHPRVMMTPHIGASTIENQARSGIAAAEILLDRILS